MPRTKVNKSEKIRETLDTLGNDARPKDVIALLAKKRIKVSSAQVSMIKAKRAPSNRRGVALDDLLAAKEFVEKVGSIAAARNALDALAKIVE